MARKNTAEFEISAEAEAAYLRIVARAHRMAAALLGDPLTADGEAATKRATAFASGMLYFLLRIEPDDLHAAFAAEGSFAQHFKPENPGQAIRPLFRNSIACGCCNPGFMCLCTGAPEARDADAIA